jgi:hypothetical protein
MSFCQHLPVIIFDQCHLFRKKAGLQGFIKKIITPELLEINNCGNAASIRGTFPDSAILSEIFVL